MSDLTRRKFLIGAPIVAVVAVVGAVVVRDESPSFPVITEDDSAGWVSAGRAQAYWQSADTEYIALQPKAPYWVFGKDIAPITRIF